MAQKVVTARKMKSRQETTSLCQIATVTAKPAINDKHFINTDTRRFKIQTGNMGTPPLPPGMASVMATVIIYSLTGQRFNNKAYEFRGTHPT